MEERLLDFMLSVAAETLDDLEKNRIALDNRIRALTRDEPDKDGLTRGWALSDNHPDVERLLAIREGVAMVEHEAELYLGRMFKTHLLYPWAKAQKGIGVKQGARLLAAIGDPYVRPEIVTADGTVEPARPRRGPDELKAYCGYDVRDGRAPARKKGVKANWNATARMRLYLVTESCMKTGVGGPYRKVYDAEREYLVDAEHSLACPRCGPKGKPALPGSPLSKGHAHARALRKVGQQILIDLYCESRRIYQENGWTASN